MFLLNYKEYIVRILTVNTDRYSMCKRDINGEAGDTGRIGANLIYVIKSCSQLFYISVKYHKIKYLRNVLERTNYYLLIT